MSKNNKKYCQDIRSHNDLNYIFDFEIFDKYVVVIESIMNQKSLKIIDLEKNIIYDTIKFESQLHEINFQNNVNLNCKHFRFTYSNLKNPEQIYEYNFEKKQKNYYMKRIYLLLIKQITLLNKYM